jgi:hypothetical protein
MVGIVTQVMVAIVIRVMVEILIIKTIEMVIAIKIIGMVIIIKGITEVQEMMIRGTNQPNNIKASNSNQIVHRVEEEVSSS